MQFLVVARIKNGTPRKDVISLIREEAFAAWKLYESNLVRSIHYIDDLSGAVMMFEAETREQVEQSLQSLPMISEGVLGAEIMALKPYDAYRKLFRK